MSRVYRCRICGTDVGCIHGTAEDPEKGRTPTGRIRASSPALQNLPNTPAAALEMSIAKHGHVNAEAAKACMDMIHSGTGYMQDGKHVPYETTLKDMTMTLAILTTTLARFTVPEQLVRHWRENVLAWDTCSLELYNAMGERIQFFGTATVPSIETHVPVPLGFPIESVHKQFEERAAVVLGDERGAPTFYKLEDGRYESFTIRAAWMMYLDRALFERS